MDRERLIQNSIIAGMSEGVMVIRFDGVIELANDAALSILGKRGQDLVGASFARAFFDGEENDAFIQCVLDAVYEKGRHMERYVPYRCGGVTKQLRIVSSCLLERENRIGVILVIGDLTELTEMRDAVRAMERIRGLNEQLELRNRVLQETFGRYLSDDIVREILDAPDGWKLGGQKRKLTILMSDLRGFTALSERMQPQDLITMLNHYFGLMYEQIARYHGTLIEFMGDGMLVIFGAPAASAHHAADAVAAALGMQQRMAEVNRWNLEHGYEALSMGIGINTDEVILGNIGSEKRTKYGVLGAAVNLTGRIESYTTAGQILASPGTCAAIGEALRVEQYLSVSPKGLDGEIRLAQITGLGGAYGLYLEQTRQPLQPLRAPAPVDFSLVEGKQTDQALLQGRILAVSGQEALLETGAPLQRFDNLKLRIGQELYAKVTALDEGRCRISFTAKPPCFAAWLRELHGEREQGEGTAT